MKKLVSVFLLGILTAITAFAVDAPIRASQDSENAILKAEVKHSNAVNSQQSIQMQLQSLHQQAQAIEERLQKQLKDATDEETSSSKDVDKAIADAWTASGLDKSKYDFDAANFTFTLKPTPKTAEPPTKLQEKK